MNEQDTSEGGSRQPPQSRSRWTRWVVGRRPHWTLIRSAITVIVVVVLVKTCFVPIRITGHSMEPTYHNGRINFLNLLAYHRRQPQRGDVVGVRMDGRRMILMKRILGLPGEHVSLRDGIVYINGTSLKEPYARGHAIPSMTNDSPLRAEEYFIIGDNRDVSEYGVVEREEILGKVLF